MSSQELSDVIEFIESWRENARAKLEIES